MKIPKAFPFERTRSDFGFRLWSSDFKRILQPPFEIAILYMHFIRYITRLGVEAVKIAILTAPTNPP